MGVVSRTIGPGRALPSWHPKSAAAIPTTAAVIARRVIATLGIIAGTVR
jgi:hypothetical protein